MTLSILQFSKYFSLNKQDVKPLAQAQLLGHDSSNKLDALEAIDILLRYKTTVHDFTDEIIEFWSLPRRIMERYQFDDAEQLNEWLESFS